MNEVFLKVLNMSIAASWLILTVILLRSVLKRAPKWIAVALWAIVALRLAVPFSFESALSLIPSAETFSPHNIQYETPAISGGIPTVNNAVDPALGETFAPNSVGSAIPLYIWTSIVSVIWLIGIAAMLLYAVISYVRVRRSVAERVPYEGNIFLCDHVKSPFILGLVSPKIYLPSNMDATAMEPVIAHEKAHLARRDHWWKPLGFLILTVHWFNPLCWIAYVLLCRDIELACDEKVIRRIGLDGKKQYSTALLECSTGRRLVTICPLAFGEVGVTERVKNVLKYKKPAFWVIVLAIIACAVVTMCFATDPVTKEETPARKCLTAMLECPDDELCPPIFAEPYVIKLDGSFDAEQQKARMEAEEAADAVWRERLGGYFLEGDLDRFMAQSYRLDFHIWARVSSGTVSIKEIQEEEVKDRIQWFTVTLVMTNEAGTSQECVTRWRAIYLDDSLNMLSQFKLMDDGGYYQILRDL